MTLGALANLGVDCKGINSALDSLSVSGFDLKWEETSRNGISATRAIVSTDEDHHHRGLPQILEIIDSSGIEDRAKTLAARIFTRLAGAESEVHGVPVAEIHFHEVGAVDAIVDILGAAVAVTSLGVEKVIGSPVRTGFGTVRCAHGLFPVPAPATAALLRNIPTYAGEIEGEWTTPTGAAILSTLCDSYQSVPNMKVERIGYGAGSREHDDLPNLLRIFIGELVNDRAPEVVVMETQVDDMNPQLVDHLQNRLMERGALDWYVTPVQMKKNRPGMLLTVICPPERRPELAEIIFSETTTIGYRFYSAAREELEREIVSVATPLGEVRVKLARRGGLVVNASPEFEDCRRIAEESGRPLKEIRDLAISFYLDGDKPAPPGD